jgi:hypothetical protein
MAKESEKDHDERCRECAYEIFDVMGKYELSLGEEVRVLAGVLYSSIAVWNQDYSKFMVERALRLFVGFMHPITEDKEHEKLETLLKKHFV